MTKIADELANIKQAIAADNDSSTAAIDNSIVMLSAARDPDAVKAIILLLSDHFSYPDGMWSLIHYAESFPSTYYVECLVDVIDALNAKSPDWGDVLLARIMNSDPYFNVLLKEMKQAEIKKRDACVAVAARVDRDNPGRYTHRMSKINENLS